MTDSQWLSELGRRIQAAAIEVPFPNPNIAGDEIAYQYHDPRLNLWNGQCACGEAWPCQEIRGLALKYGVSVPD